MALTEFDPHAEYDPTGVLDDLPEDDRSRALFYAPMLAAYRDAGIEPPPLPRPTFAMVPRRRFNEDLLTTCRALWPNRPLAGSLFEIGSGLYPRFASTMIGMAIFAVAGREYVKMATLAPRAYRLSSDHGRVELIEAVPASVHARFEDLWDFPPFAAGVWSGAVRAAGAHADSLMLDIRRPGSFELRFRFGSP